ncbi:MFS transporter [Chitinophaga barathri]|uniref:MFS transporter n=1 Tax=Chitinophaga barathri TaxID=1647451 RepID=A0A3N4MBR2_9BACT|nr:MFS transporter [Chitinophaga barathri]RPD40845.1 MFS transporter [Chitinophaga barathri]
MIINKWHARLAVSAFFFLNGLCFSSWGSRIPAIQERHGLSEAGLSALLLCIPIGALLSLPFAGWLVSRTGSRPVMLAAALLYAAFLSLIGLAGNPFILGAILFVFGFIGNLGNISINTQAVSVEALYGQTIMSSFHAVWSLAGLTGAGIGTLMVNLFVPPSMHFFFISAIALVITAFAYRYALPEPAQLDTSRPPIFVKPDKTLIGLGIIAFCCMICEGTMYDWSGVYFVKAVHAAPGQVTMGFTAFTLATTFGRLNGDWLTRRYGITGMLRGSGLLTAAGLLLAVLLPQPIPAAIGFFLVGLGVSTVIPLVYSEAGRSTTMSQSMALAAVSTVGFLGFLAGPPIIGFIAQAAGLRASFAGIALMGLMISILAARKKA